MVMSTAGIIIIIFLSAGSFTILLSCFTIALIKNPFVQLHYLGLAGTTGSFCISVALIIDNPWSSFSFKVIVIFLLIALTNAAGTHLTARALKAREGRIVQ